MEKILQAIILQGANFKIWRYESYRTTELPHFLSHHRATPFLIVPQSCPISYRTTELPHFLSYHRAALFRQCINKTLIVVVRYNLEWCVLFSGMQRNFVLYYQITLRHIPQNSNLHVCRRHNLKNLIYQNVEVFFF
jgi:hypothetical protein